MNELLTYYDQLKKLADKKGIKLSTACQKAGVQASTYHRIKSSKYSLRESTAVTVWNYIYEIKNKKKTKR